MPSNILSHFTVVGGISSNSTSPTDVWILKLNKDILDLDAPEYVMKLFVSSKTVRKVSAILGNPKSNFENALDTMIPRDVQHSEGMEYEIGVYNHIKETLILPKVCTNFVEIITPPTGGASYEEMIDLLIRSASKMKMTKVDVMANFYESILFMLFDTRRPRKFTIDLKTRSDPDREDEYQLSYRPRLSEVTQILGSENVDFIDSEFSKFFGPSSDVDASFDFAISEMTNASLSPIIDGKETILTLKEVLSYRYRHFDKSFLSTGEVASIVFQTFCACVAMSDAAGVFHNDLHFDNVFVEIYDEPSTHRYKLVDNLGKIVFDNVLTTRFKVRIFDFDRSYAQRLGPNPLVEYLRFCGPFHSCNKVGNNLANIVPISAWLSGCSLDRANAKESKVGDLIVDALARDELAKEDIHTLFKYTCVTNNSKYTTSEGLNNRDSFNKNSKDIAGEMLALRAKSSGDQPFFTMPSGKKDIFLNMDIYSWKMFDDVEKILIKLSNEISGTFEKFEPASELQDDVEFEFNLVMSTRRT